MSSRVATDFIYSAALARDLDRPRTTPGLLPALRQAGLRERRPLPLSVTAQSLSDLGSELGWAPTQTGNRTRRATERSNLLAWPPVHSRLDL